MKDVLYLAWRYLAYHRLKTCVLIASIAMIVYLPIGLNVLVSQSANQLTSRAATTPLLVGAKGSPLELVLSSLYFDSDVPPPMRYSELRRIEDSELAAAIPLYARYRTRHSRIVGTSLDYFDFRGLKIEHGRRFAMLGECVLGAQAALAAKAQPGDFVMSAPENVFDIAGTYPLRMKVVGVLKPTGSPDDRVVFVDVKTAWVIEGLGHGHQDMRQANQEAVLRREGQKIVANASVVQYNEITAENADSFHFHGEVEDFPITAVIAQPQDRKSSTLLQGRYLGDAELVQVVRPSDIMDQMLKTVFTIKRYVMLAVAVVGVATLATMALVFMLSLQLRRREMETMIKIGGSRSRVASLVAAEILSVLLTGAVLAGAMTVATIWLASAATRVFVQLA